MHKQNKKQKSTQYKEDKTLFFERNPSPISELTNGSPQTESSDIYKPPAALSRSIVTEPTELILPFTVFPGPTESSSSGKKKMNMPK